MMHASRTILDSLPMTDLLHCDDHPHAVRHEDLQFRLHRLLPPSVKPGAATDTTIDALIDDLVARRWIMPLTLWRCSAADGWPAPIVVYRRGPDCPEAPVPA